MSRFALPFLPLVILPYIVLLPILLTARTLLETGDQDVVVAMASTADLPEEPTLPTHARRVADAPARR